MPKTWRPKLLQSNAANHRADLETTIDDLEHVVGCCDLILNKGQHPIENLEAAALLDSLAIRYRRCFKGGIRQGLDPKALDSIKGPAFALHTFFWFLASKHIAHSVNGFQLNASTIHIAEDKAGKIHRGGIGSQGGRTLELCLLDIQRFGALVQKLIDEVKTVHVARTKEVQLETELMSEAELRALPDGFAPLDGQMSVIQSREWPKRSTAVKNNP